jgi:uncharacterized protein (TIGR00730 family)
MTDPGAGHRPPAPSDPGCEPPPDPRRAPPTMTESRFRGVKAYENEGFLNGPDARPLRILSEYLEPETRFRELKVRDTIVFFGSARIPPRDLAEAEVAAAERGEGDLAQAKTRLAMSRYYEEARELARRLTLWSKGLSGTERRFVVCSGGGPGIMEAANRGASEARGENVGLNIQLPFEQVENPYITRRLAFEFHYFFMRKFWFTYLAKAMVIMPGGYGTLDEFMEMVTLVQTKRVTKPMPIILYGTEYWNEVLNFEPMIRHGMISPEDTSLFFRTSSVDEAFDHLTHELEAHALKRQGAGTGG